MRTPSRHAHTAPAALIAAALLSLALAAPGRAEEADSPTAEVEEDDPKEAYELTRGEFAWGVNVGKAHGFGGGIRLLGPVGFELNAGVSPWLIVIMGDCTHVAGHWLFHADSSFLIRAATIADRMRVLIKLGGGWEERVGPSARFGGAFDIYPDRHVAFEIGWGVQIVPGAEAFMEAEQARACPGDQYYTVDQSSAAVQPYVGLTIYFRP